MTLLQKLFKLHKHKWTKWKTIKFGDVVDTEGSIVGFYVLHSRTCLDCNFVEIKEEET